jgi:HSP20 family protein
MARKKERPPFWFEESFERFRKLEEEFHRMLSEFWRNPFEFTFPELRFPRMRISTEFIRNIPIDLAETDKEIIVRADLPGFNKEEIRIKATEDTLEIVAEKKKEKVEKGKTFYRQERMMGSASRLIRLPERVKPEEAKAKFENGVLEIILPKAEVKKPKEKEIRIE